MSSFFNIPFEFQDMTTFTAEQVNADFSALLSAVNSLQEQINSGAGSGVASLNGVRGTVALTSTGGTVTITPGVNSIDLEASGGNNAFIVSSMVPTNTGAANAIALQADLGRIATLGGGTLLLPNSLCQVSGPVYIGAPNNQSPGTYISLRIAGTGPNSTIQQTGNTDTFQVNCDPGGGQQTGIRFENFKMYCASGATAGAAIRVTSGVLVLMYGMSFQDCPVAIANDNGLQVAAIACCGTYTNNTSPSGLAMITVGSGTVTGLQANETYIAGWRGLSHAQNTGGGGGTGIAVFNSRHLRMSDCRFDAFVQGIAIIPGPTGGNAGVVRANDVTCYTSSSSTSVGAALLIQPQGGKQTFDHVFTSCEFQPSSVAGTTYTGAGIVIDGTLSTGGTIDNVRFISCDSSGWNGPGAQLNSGSAGSVQNIEFLGGSYVCNGQTAGAGTPQGAGIYLHGTSGGKLEYVRIVGAALHNESLLFTAAQLYGVAVDGGAQQITVADCPMTGVLTAGIYASSPGVHFFVNGCAGYNNLGTVLATSLTPATTVQFDGTTIGSPAYYGPIGVFYNGGTITDTLMSHDRVGGLSAQSTGQTTGYVYLASGQSMALTYSVTPTKFVAIGM